ncbi:hypothetical protein SAMN05444920_13180 [Nonomuraea solani]|uniref:Uncharacterized protein n=1 Tax=Nonomuraea solani TaxID=1144553 RepID=A0A1H6EYI5_9ACTN|nr:hypothetical protein [Nonomuraea solani]SEH02968.1 hypothetical protein SAMN05444920_13180 [Nonomuraea solani]
MRKDLEVADEAAGLVGQENLDQLARAATVSYECWLCMRPGKLPDTPAAVLALRDGPVTVAKLAHRFCSESLVMDVPGLTSVMYDPARAVSVDAEAAFLPYQAGHRPALLLEVRATVSMDAGQDERVDRAAGWLLEHGLHLMAAAGEQVRAALGWAVQLIGGGGLRVTGPGGEFYGGNLQADPAWRRAVTTHGRCLLLVGAGLSLNRAPHSLQDALDRVDAVVRQGRLAGAMVTVESR